MGKGGEVALLGTARVFNHLMHHKVGALALEQPRKSGNRPER